MALSFLTPARTVLLIGDETLSVYNVTFNQSKLAGSVLWTADDFEERVTRLIRHDCNSKPILLLNDMTDQHFKGGQRMPKISIMDRQSVLERKLQVAFPNYPIRGALQIKQSKKDALENREGTGSEAAAKSAGGLFLFSGIPMSEPIAKAINVAKRSMASITGLVLLPVEAADMVASLSAKLNGKERQGSRWTIFIGQHRSGALRQVITRDGQLAMTRMTPAADSEASPARWAAEVSQEFKATIGYLSRFGYGQEDGTDVIVIADPDSGEALKSLIDIPCNYTSFTVNEAARLLGMSIGLQDEQRFADPLHAAWSGRKSKFILPMKAQELASVVRPRQMAAAAMFLLILGGGYFAWQMISQVQEMATVQSNLSDQEDALKAAKKQEDAEAAKMLALGFDIKLIKSSINAFEKLKRTEMDPLPVIQKIGAALGGDMRLSSLKMEMVDPATTLAGVMGYQPSPPPADGTTPAEVDKDAKEMLATLTLNFPPTIEPAEGVKEINDLQTRLQQAFPKHSVTVSKQVADLAYTANTSGKIGGATGEVTQQPDYMAELQIRGGVR
jgi:hypothetical protein